MVHLVLCNHIEFLKLHTLFKHINFDSANLAVSIQRFPEVKYVNYSRGNTLKHKYEPGY